MSVASLKVNGRIHKVDVDPKCPLLYVLRDNLALNNPGSAAGWDNAARVPCSWTIARCGRAN